METYDDDQFKIEIGYTDSDDPGKSAFIDKLLRLSGLSQFVFTKEAEGGGQEVGPGSVPS